MIDSNNSLETLALEDLIEVRGCLSRTEWELVYLAANKFAQERGLSITRFDLKSVEIGANQKDVVQETAAGGPNPKIEL